MVIGIGTRYSDFTTASKTAFQNKDVRFININITEFDACKHSGLALTGDARVIIQELNELLSGYQVEHSYRNRVAAFNKSWDGKVSAAYLPDTRGLPSQAEVIGAVNTFSGPDDVLVCAAGSLPGDLHKLWRTRSSKGFHLEYGYSCMGYEISGGIGTKIACPEKEIYVMVGDGSYLMMPSEIVTSVQEGIKLTIILIDNHGFASIGGLSGSIGSKGFGTRYVYRDHQTGELAGAVLPVDLAANAASLGANVIRTGNIPELEQALKQAKSNAGTTVICIETVPERKMKGYGYAWWDVPVAEVSEMDSVAGARENYMEHKKRQRYFL